MPAGAAEDFVAKCRELKLDFVLFVRHASSAPCCMTDRTERRSRTTGRSTTRCACSRRRARTSARPRPGSETMGYGPSPRF